MGTVPETRWRLPALGLSVRPTEGACVVPFLIGAVRAIDAMNEWIGRVTAWLTLGTVLVCAAVVVLRYAFAYGSICLQEIYVWEHAVVFMVGAGYTLLHRGHVRVDIFYAAMSRRARAWVDLIGTLLFLLPWLAVLVWFGWPFVRLSWSLLEPSSQAGGCQGFFLLKSVVMVFAAVVALQGAALAARSILVLAGRELPEAAEPR
jgi:TRAP-type mannitol/chloroaromatic compound transport system permease small subunit